MKRHDHSHQHHAGHHGPPAAHSSGMAMGHSHHHGGGGNDVPMRMYFHSDVHDLLLFEAFVTKTAGTYTAALLGVFVLALGYALFLYLVKPCLYTRFLHVGGCNPHKSGGGGGGGRYSEKIAGEGRRTTTMAVFQMELRRAGYALLHAFELSYSLLLMLVVMTFNAGWCAAVIGGVFLGTYLFRRGAYYSADEEGCVMECTALPKDPRESSGLCC